MPVYPGAQWVLSLPFDVRARAAYDAPFLTAVVRAFASALDARHSRWARSIGLERTQFAAVTFVQRFGSSLNLNVHLHVAAVDGVFSRDACGAVCFTAAPPPTHAEMLAVVERVRARVAKLAPPTATPPQPPLEACARVALSRGDVRATAAELTEHSDEIAPPVRDGAAVDQAGFNVEASVRIAADDDFGREHLLRYCARPPLSLARLVELPNRKIGYRIKKLRNGRSKLRVMTPLELLARLAALVPPPRHPLVRFHGAFAPRSSWRRDVVPKPRDPVRSPDHAHAPKRPSKPPAPQPPPSASPRAAATSPPARAATPAAPPPNSPATLTECAVATTAVRTNRSGITD